MENDTQTCGIEILGSIPIYHSGNSKSFTFPFVPVDGVVSHIALFDYQLTQKQRLEMMNLDKASKFTCWLRSIWAGITKPFRKKKYTFTFYWTINGKTYFCWNSGEDWHKEQIQLGNK